jgi:hypothetical protein
MAQNAIGNSANIFLQGSQLYQNANSKIFDAISQAADMYQQQELQRQANLNALRVKQGEIDRSPEAILAMAIQNGPGSLTPQQKAAFQANQQIEGAKVAIQPVTGQAYNPYAAIDINSIGKPAAAAPASPVADMMLPPRADGSAGTAGQFNADMLPAPTAETPAPSPIGYAEEKQPKDDTGMSDTPVGKMEKYKSGLDASKEIAVNDAKTQGEQRKADFYKPKLQDVLDKMANINEQLQKSGALKSADKSGLSNALNMAAGAEIPFTGIKPGRAAEEVVSKRVASLRDQYDGLRSNAMQLLKNAANISAGSMNSDAEQKLALSSFGESNGNYEANKAALTDTASSFGTKKAEKADAAAYAEGQTATNPKTGEKMVFKGGKWQKM